MALGYQNPFYLKQAWQKQQSLYNGKVLLEKHDPLVVYDSEETLQLAQESRLKMKQLNKEIKPANYTKINHLSGIFVSQTAKSREELYFSNTSKTANVSKPILIPNEEFSDDTTPSVAQKFLNEVKSTIVTLQQAAKFIQVFKSIAKEADESLAKHKDLELEIERLLRAVVSQDIMSIMKSNSVVDISNLQTELERNSSPPTHYSAGLRAQQVKKGLEQDKDLEKRNEVLNYAKENAHLKTTYKNLFDSINVTRTQTKTIIDSLQHKLHDTIYENAKLRAQLFDKASEQKDITKGMSANTKFANQSTVRKPSLQSLKNKFVVRQPNAFQSERQNFSKLRVPQKVDETNDLSNPVTSNSVPTPQESKVVKIDNVIAPKMLGINPSRRVLGKITCVPINKVRASGPPVSKSSCVKNKEVEVEEHHRNLLLSKNKKPMSSECNNIKLSIHNDKSEVVCAMCKQCLITANHDVCVLNYVSDMNSRGGHQLEEFLIFKEKIIASSESEFQSNCSNGDNACTSNPQEPISKRFPNSTFSLKFLGTVRFGNDHVAAILGYGDLQWGNIMITRVYFVEGLGHNLFSVGQYCDSDLEVTFRRNTCFVRNLERVNLLKGNCTTNLYTINLLEMASASPICLMARATSTKSCLWHQRLSHLNFDTINDLAKNVSSLVFQNLNIIKNIFVPHLNKEKAKRHLTHPNLFQILSRDQKMKHLRRLKPFSRKLLFYSKLQSLLALCYPKNDREDIGKLGAKGDIGFFIGYLATSCAYRLLAMDFEQSSLKPKLQGMTSGQISSGLDLTFALSTITTKQPTERELDLLFEAMYDDYIGGQPSSATRIAPAAQAPQVFQTSTASTTTADTALTLTN
ncbi:hypothetical protein Tco_0287164 [Tanacetum coccineum]